MVDILFIFLLIFGRVVIFFVILTSFVCRYVSVFGFKDSFDISRKKAKNTLKVWVGN